MSGNTTQATTNNDALVKDLLAALDNLFGLHPGFRGVHAKGAMCRGTFTPSAQAAGLTRAPHVARPSTPVVVRFSDFAGVPTVPDNDPQSAGPRGMAIRFYLAEHVHTDIVAHSHDGFPVRTGEEFLEFARALAASGPGVSKPTPIDQFLAVHPRALEFATAPKPIPTSFARESFFAVSAFRFTNANGATRYGRYRIRPEVGNAYLSDEQAAAKSPNFLMDELGERLSQEPISFRIFVQVAAEGDVLDDATVHWPGNRAEIEFGTVTLDQRTTMPSPSCERSSLTRSHASTALIPQSTRCSTCGPRFTCSADGAVVRRARRAP